MNPQNRRPEGHSSAREVLCFYRHHAKVKGRDFNLTEEQFRELIVKPCIYCGDCLTNERHGPRRNGAFKYTGLDRIDSQKGYTLENTAPCCSACNFMKRHHTAAAFLSQVEKIYRHQQEATK